MEAKNDISAKWFKICKGSIEMLKSLVEDFIDFTRFENDSVVPINKKSVNLKFLIENVKDMFEMQAEEKQIDLKVNIDNKVPDFFKTDPLRLKQILMNLLSNALKFTSKGSIEVDVLFENFIEDDDFFYKTFNEESKTINLSRVQKTQNQFHTFGNPHKCTEI